VRRTNAVCALLHPVPAMPRCPLARDRGGHDRRDDLCAI